MYNHGLSIRLQRKVTSHLKLKSILCSNNLVHILKIFKREIYNSTYK
jgi:hypothetical protein